VAEVMSKMTAPTKATGGGGTGSRPDFLRKCSSGNSRSIEIDLGVMTELHFETRDIGYVLDDLRLTLKRGPAETRCSVSVKSNRQLTKSGFNIEFVRDEVALPLGCKPI
jgi:hypothetical protein